MAISRNCSGESDARDRCRSGSARSAGCLLQPDAAEKAAEDARAIAQVEAAQRNGQPPVKPIDPQPIMFFDIRDGKLTGTGCNFVADGGGMGAILLAQDERGVMKLDGKLVIFASDKGSKQLPQAPGRAIREGIRAHADPHRRWQGGEERPCRSVQRAGGGDRSVRPGGLQGARQRPVQADVTTPPAPARA
jgi:hypothetical protein